MSNFVTLSSINNNPSGARIVRLLVNSMATHPKAVSPKLLDSLRTLRALAILNTEHLDP